MKVKFWSNWRQYIVNRSAEFLWLFSVALKWHFLNSYKNHERHCSSLVLPALFRLCNYSYWTATFCIGRDRNCLTRLAATASLLRVRDVVSDTGTAHILKNARRYGWCDDERTHSLITYKIINFFVTVWKRNFGIKFITYILVIFKFVLIQFYF